MAVETPSGLHPRDILYNLRAFPLRWAAPTVLLTLLALGYALVRPASWEAQQALIVRDEAAGHAGSLSRPGQFGQADQMKTAQETILELVKGRGVMGAALTEIGPPAGKSADGWPTDAAIESLQGRVKLVPPKGAEFGKTEVFYLKVTDCSRERALALAAAVSKQLQTRFEKLREMRAQSVIGELGKSVSLAKADLETSTRKLAQLEAQVGPDLAELRMLNESPSGDSEMRRVSTELENELRVNRALVAANEELLKLLTEAQVDQGRLLASPSRLLESQPGLRRLKEGLVDAQLRTAAALGSLSEDHPLAQTAKSAEAAISANLNNEIQIAIKGVGVDLRLARQRVLTLEQQRLTMQNRMSGLAELRADYSNLVIATRYCGEILKTAQQDLAEAHASQAAAHTANLISLVDKPDAGTRAAGPGRATIVLAGLIGGLATGLGIIFLTAQPRPKRRPSLAASEALSVEMNAVARSMDTVVDLPIASFIDIDTRTKPIEPQPKPSTISLTAPDRVVIQTAAPARVVPTAVEPIIVAPIEVTTVPTLVMPIPAPPVTTAPRPGKQASTADRDKRSTGLKLGAALQRLSADPVLH